MLLSQRMSAQTPAPPSAPHTETLKQNNWLWQNAEICVRRPRRLPDFWSEGILTKEIEGSDTASTLQGLRAIKFSERVSILSGVLWGQSAGWFDSGIHLKRWQWMICNNSVGAVTENINGAKRTTFWPNAVHEIRVILVRWKVSNATNELFFSNFRAFCSDKTQKWAKLTSGANKDRFEECLQRNTCKLPSPSNGVFPSKMTAEVYEVDFWIIFPNCFYFSLWSMWGTSHKGCISFIFIFFFFFFLLIYTYECAE